MGDLSNPHEKEDDGIGYESGQGDGQGFDEDHIDNGDQKVKEQVVSPKQEGLATSPPKSKKQKLARRRRAAWLDEDRLQNEKQMAHGGLNMQPQQVQQQNGGKKDALKLRLDLNLEIEIELKAKIHGDLTLSLL
ncbi:hypothetical protein BGZ63DRAFT_409508 [Mariannaea sp. PMI_226]|nr:hypothetical protein BGZ63DRAFT_409508 [Mariannaea sp. PMI_226]